MDIVRCPVLNQQSCELIVEFMDEQCVREVRVRRHGVMKQTNTSVFTFNTPELLTVIKIGFIQAKADVYFPDPLRCFQCQVFGHHGNKCSRQAMCNNCGMPEHCPSDQCQRLARCAICSDDHPVNSTQCPQWQIERKIIKQQM